MSLNSMENRLARLERAYRIRSFRMSEDRMKARINALSIEEMEAELKTLRDANPGPLGETRENRTRRLTWMANKLGPT